MKKILDIIKSLKTGTVIRTILQFLVYINQAVVLFGQNTFASNPVYQWITFILTVVITLISYWYNNDWTNFAHISGDVFEMLKDGKITKEELENFLKEHSKERSNIK